MGVRLGGPYLALYGTIPVVFYLSQVQYPRRNRRSGQMRATS